MLRNTISCLVVSFLLICSYIGFTAQIGEAAEYKVLVVMSYEEDFPWDREMKEGIESVLAAKSEIRYFYMDTKKFPAGGPDKAKEAYEIYSEFQPDGVIVSDDNGQSMFVVPYLKDKTETPVMFCGVNAAPEKYGYPAKNVSGILERESIRESLMFAQQLMPALSTFGFITLDDATSRALVAQIDSEVDGYPMKFTGTKMAQTVEDAIEKTAAFEKTSDLLLYITLEGLKNKDGAVFTDKELVPLINEKFGKPMITNAAYRVEYGILCATVKTGQEQGTVAAEMLLKAMAGTPVSSLPIQKNQYGRRFINADELKRLGIKPKPSILRSAAIIKTKQ